MRAWSVCLALACFVCGCNLVFGIEPGEPRSTGAGGSGGTGTGGGSGEQCPPVALPAMCDEPYLADDENCCVKGRSCQGGSCVSGRCSPVVIRPDATNDARGIAVAGDRVLWATGCSAQVRSCNKDGSGETILPAGDHCTPTIAVHGDRVYSIEWDGPHLQGAPVAGTAAPSTISEVPVSMAQAVWGRLAVDAANAYWATQSPPGVWTAPLGGSQTPPFALASDSTSAASIEKVTMPFGVASDGAFAYWSDQGSGAIKRRSIGSIGMDVAAELVAGGEPQVKDIAVDASRVYWVTEEGFVRSKAKDGSGTSLTLASGEPRPEAILVDDRYVYWTNFMQGGDVRRTPKGGGAIEILAAGQMSPFELAQDCETLYWTNQNEFGTGEVVKVAK